ncbi:hypothetical protein V6O07_14790, partial [Arthrospira platensis SPKY2]
MKRVLRLLGRSLAILLLAFVLVQAWFFAHVLWWKHNDPTSTRFMRLQLAELRRNDPQASLRHQWVP